VWALVRGYGVDRRPQTPDQTGSRDQQPRLPFLTKLFYPEPIKICPPCIIRFRSPGGIQTNLGPDPAAGLGNKSCGNRSELNIIKTIAETADRPGIHRNP